MALVEAASKMSDKDALAAEVAVLRGPGLRLAIEINERVRRDDEWFDEPDVDRVEAARLPTDSS